MEPGFLPLPKNFATILNHAGQEVEKSEYNSVVPPLVMTSTFKYLSPTEPTKYKYSRAGNPTRESLETCLAEIEHTKFALTFSSGLGASTVLLHLLKPGDQIVAAKELYGGYICQFNHMKGFGIDVMYIDFTNVANVEKAIKSNTKMVFIETPTNPSLSVFDIRKISEITKKKGVMFVVDNTFLTAYLQRPLDMGADLTIYSISKYLGGHTDVVMGALVTKCEKLYEKLKYLQVALGIVPSPFDCYQALRGMKTLHIRLKKHAENAYLIAKYLENHPKVQKVIYPSLPSHPQYEITKNQTSGSSGMLAFYINGPTKTCNTFLKSLNVFILAASLGGTESLICVPYYMTHPQLTAEEKKDVDITQTLLRISVGIEDVEILIDDLKQAFDKC